MSTFKIALWAVAGIGFAGMATAQMTAATASPSLSKDGYAAAKTEADAQYKIDESGCATLSGNAKDICSAQITGKRDIAKADSEAAYENTAKNREAARVTRAEANYAVAMQRCDDLAGNTKDVCVSEGKAVLVKEKAGANVERVGSDSRRDAAVKQSDAKSDAMTETNDANYKVAIEKCDALAGERKDACVASAKNEFNKS